MGQRGREDARNEALERLTLARVLGIARDVARHVRVTGQEETWVIRSTAVSAMPRWSLLHPSDSSHPLRRATDESPSSALPPEDLLGFVAAEPGHRDPITVCVVLCDGRALEVDVTSHGEVNEPRADTDVDSPVSQALRRALALPVEGRDPVEFYCDLYGFICAAVPLTDDPAVHAVLTDPLVALIAPAPSTRRDWLTAARLRAVSGEDWVDSAGDFRWEEQAPRLVAVAARLLGAPRGFTLGEDPARAMERLMLLVPATARSDFLLHPSARFIIPVLAQRCASWGADLPSWLDS